MDRLYDNTRLSAFKRCPRYFYYRHRRDWIKEGVSAIALIFGSAWHRAMDSLWLAYSDRRQILTVDQAVDGAHLAFMQNWIENSLPSESDLTGILSMKLVDMSDEEKDFRMRNPMTAKEMLWEYAEKRRAMFLDPSFELVAVEQPFAVPLDPDDDSLLYVGRLDKVFRYKGQLLVGEHKTTSAYKAGGPFRGTFLESFSPDAQIDGYAYAAHMLYGDEFKAVWVDAALVHKDIHDGFLFIPVERQLSQLDGWLWETRQWIHQIEVNDATVYDLGEYMPAFAKNTNSCWDFFRACPYLSLCKMWADPSVQGTPIGYVEEKWEPFKELKLSEIGLKEA